MARVNRSGSVLSFILIGMLLTGLLVGGAYLVRHLLTPLQPIDQSESTPKPEENITNSPQQITGQEPQPSPAPEPPVPAPVLPQSGPADTSSVLALALLTALTVSFFHSRRSPSSL